MKRIFRYLLLCVCLVGLLHVNANAAVATEVSVELTGVKTVKIYTSDKKTEIQVHNNTFSVQPGEYYYVDTNGAEGKFTVTEDTKELNLATVTFSTVSPMHFSDEQHKWLYLADLGTLKLYDEKQQIEYGHATDSVYQYLVPEYDGDSYYIFQFTPFDENYLPIEGHFYVYSSGTGFGALNLSDAGKIPYLKKSYITVKAPVGMEIYTTWQLKFYTARNWQSYTAYKTENGYNYYKIPEGFTYMMRQEGKVTRYTKTLDGEWNKEHTEITVSALADDPGQIHREQEKDGIYASMLTNLPENSEIDLQVGEYFDLVPLRAWQAVEDGVGNKHNDPEWHYIVLGNNSNIASVEITEDDKIGQFGRIHATGEGTVLVAFYYDAVECSSIKNSSGTYIYSALLPELTGIAVVHVSGEKTAESETKITSNIDMIEGRTVYYIKSQTGTDGISYDMNNSAEYTFTPTAKTGENQTEITSVRVHKPITVENGKLSENPNNWLNDSSWTTYQANTNTDQYQKSYTIQLSEGRNIVEIKAGDATTYHVISARGLDVTIDNVYRAGCALEVGDTAKITLNNLIPPMFKMSAIYNPSGVNFTCKANGVDYTAQFGQYMAGSSFNVTLQEEDAGTFQITEGALITAAWGTADGAHRQLTRNSMTGYWNGGNNPNIDYGKMAYIPDISFEVVSNDDYEEITNRSAGLLKALAINYTKSETTQIVEGSGAWFVTASEDIRQNINRSVSVNPATGRMYFYVGADLLQEDENARVFVRYWFGQDKESAKIQEITFKESYIQEKNGFKSRVICGVQLKDCKASELTTNYELNTEVIVVPSSGTAMTYATHTYLVKQEGNVTFIPENIQISSASEGKELGRWDGILEAKDISYTDSEGQAITQDLGYGFIGTENFFTTSVANDIDQIKLSVSSSSLNDTAVIKDVSIKLNNSEQTYSEGQAIPLEVGKNTLEVTCNANVGKDSTYTIEVTRRTAPKQTTFEVPEGASVLVMQGSKVMKANEDGTYTLENGTYTYYVSKSGYLTGTDSFTVTDEEPNLMIRIESLESVPEQSGTVSVQLTGQSTVFCPTTAVEIPQEAADLTANRYVQYNHGGYTVLHALLDAAKSSGTSFDCYKGKFALVDDSITENNGKKAAWVCKVNGFVCSDPANVLVENGDKIELFYSSGWEGMLHARLTPETGEISRGDSIVLTVTGTGVYGTDVEAGPVADAEIYDGNILLGTTDQNGQLTVVSNTLLLGTHRFTAVKKDEADHNILTAVMSTVNIKKIEDSSADPNTTTVTFRLIGDTKHGEEGSDNEAVHAYTTWIATGTYTFDKENVTVGEVFSTALDEAGLSYEGLEKNYISAITAPEVCGGFKLEQKDNGKNSGWMYTVNGVHPGLGLNEWYVSNGDEIVWHYIDDYQTEQSDMKNDDGDYASGGNASTWNKWLEALDETPGAKEKAAAVTGKINQIGETIELTEDCEASITAARAAYDALTREEKSYVENYKALQEAEEALAALKKEKADKEAADAVITLIKELPDAESLTLEHQEAVANAGKVYRELTADQKALVNEDEEGETYKKLFVAEGIMAELLGDEAVQLVVEELTALPEAGDVTLEHEAALSAAYDHYMTLTEEQQGKVDEALVTKLNDAIEQLNRLKQEAEEKETVEAVNELLNNLPSEDEVLFTDQTDIEAARAAYEALDNLQAQVSPDALAKLTAAENRLNALQEEVNQVVDLIDALPAMDELTAEDADQVKTAKDAYNALNNDQKRLLTENGALSKLLIAENQISWLQKDVEAAKKVTDRIGSLPTVKELKLADKTAVQAARNAYEGLSDEQKQYVSADTLQTLADCEAELQRLEAVTPAPTPDSGTTPTPTPTPDSEASEETVTLTYQNYPISVTGKVSAYDLRLTALKASDDSVKQMQKKISSKEALIRLYDVQMYLNGTAVDWEEPITINFQVGEKYNGKKLTVLHDVDGTIEKLKGTVSDGILSVTADSLSPFGVVVTASTVTASGVTNSDASTATTVTNGNLNGTVGTAANGTSAQASAEGVTGTGTITSAATGDNTDLLLPVAGLITASGALGGVVLYYKKKRRNTGVQTEEDQ